MGGRPQALPQAEDHLIGPVEAAWSREIRDYLLGRMPQAGAVQKQTLPSTQALPSSDAPIRNWWIFEGKTYDLLGASLAVSWDRVAALARALDRTHNPRLRLSDQVDGLVDWPTTLARGYAQHPRAYVVRASAIGLDDQERAALRGWVAWIDAEWREYAQKHKLSGGPNWGSLLECRDPPAPEQLRRWLHITHRSRWPFLRHVVASSLRPAVEPTELDHIPLPAERAALFEILCLVRIARAIAPPPAELRWLDNKLAENTLKLDGATIRYQESLGRPRVLQFAYPPHVSAALEAFEVSVPDRIDIAVDFATPRAGFAGMIIEVKSGKQQPADAVSQLLAYAAARRRRAPADRYVCWGIVESPQPSLSAGQAAHLAGHPDDIWVFSSASGLGDVLSALSMRA